MPIDTTGWTTADLEAALAQLTAELRDRQQAEQDDQATIRAGLTDAATALDTLLGPVGAPPGITTIRGMRGYDSPTLASNAGLALTQILAGVFSVSRPSVHMLDDRLIPTLGMSIVSVMSTGGRGRGDRWHYICRYCRHRRRWLLGQEIRHWHDWMVST